jgi:hypothetical protein
MLVRREEVPGQYVFGKRTEEAKKAQSGKRSKR